MTQREQGRIRVDAMHKQADALQHRADYFAAQARSMRERAHRDVVLAGLCVASNTTASACCGRPGDCVRDTSPIPPPAEPCGRRLLLGQGQDSWDPVCCLPSGHHGMCAESVPDGR